MYSTQQLKQICNRLYLNNVNTTHCTQSMNVVEDVVKKRKIEYQIFIEPKNKTAQFLLSIQSKENNNNTMQEYEQVFPHQSYFSNKEANIPAFSRYFCNLNNEMKSIFANPHLLKPNNLYSFLIECRDSKFHYFRSNQTSPILYENPALHLKNVAHVKSFQTSQGQYTGQSLLGSICHGVGLLQLPDGRKYYGQWMNNLSRGEGVLYRENKIIYKGYWNNNLYEGRGMLFYDNGNCFQGSFIGGKRVGFGIYEGRTGNHQGAYYQLIGQWQNDRLQGMAELKVFQQEDSWYSAIGSVTNCIFREEKPDRFQLKQLRLVYQPSGSITIQSHNNDQIDQDLIIDFITGQICIPRTAFYQTGIIKTRKFYFIGQTQYNRFGSKGLLCTPQFIYEGQFSQNVISGHGSKEYKNGCFYTGNFICSKEWGQGKLLLSPIYCSYEGDFKEGRICGEGKYTTDRNCSFKGYWINDKRHGNGVLCIEYDDQKYEMQGNYMNNTLQIQQSCFKIDESSSKRILVEMLSIYGLSDYYRLQQERIAKEITDYLSIWHQQ